jgi:uncharacterized protein
LKTFDLRYFSPVVFEGLVVSRLTFQVDQTNRVSGLLNLPDRPWCCFAFAHGAGAGMEHPSMAMVAEELATLGVATLRYQFPYMERGSRRTDVPALCHATVRAAVSLASEVVPDVPLFAGGRSFGGRMTSQAQALTPLPQVRGLVFFAFPLHPAKKPGNERAKHLFDVQLPMLFLQGTRDDLATLDLLEPLIQQLGQRATLKLAQDADHSFHVRAKTGRTDADVRRELLEAFIHWTQGLIR